jgi:hypothetical protein
MGSSSAVRTSKPFTLRPYARTKVLWFTAVTSSSAMSLCICSEYGCGQAVDPLTGKQGRILTHREVKIHKIADSATIARKTSILQNAEDDAHAVMEAQIEEITMHLASQTLADKVSGPSVHDPLWSRDVVYPSGSRSPPSTPASKSSTSSTQSVIPERHSSIPSYPTSSPLRESPPAKSSPGMHREEELIRVLTDELAPDVKNLLDETVERLKCLETPSSTGPPPPFPLASLLERSTKLCQRLDGVRSKSPAVLAVASPISKKLQRIDSKLKKAEKNWIEELAHISTMKTPSYGIPHNTGISLFHLLSICV